MKVFLKGTVVGAVSVAVILAATAALAGSGVGGIFKLGVKNSVNRTSALVGNTAGAMLRVQNNGSGPAANFQVAAGRAPFAVNSNVTVANLNADMLDGKSSSDFYAAGSKVADSFHADNADHATNAENAANLGGIPASDYLRGVKFSFVADVGTYFQPILQIGDLRLKAGCYSADQILITAYTASDHAWIRTGSQGSSDFRSGGEAFYVPIHPASDSNVLVYHSAAGQVVTVQWASWQNGIGPDCQFWGTAFLAP